MTYIYHITHIENLPQIVCTGGLVCDTKKQTLISSPTSIAYDDIKDKRTRKLVPCGPQGCVADYVPFYFAPRSPMLYTINRGNIQGRDESDIIYLVSSVEWVCKHNLRYVFTDGHAIMAITNFYDDLNDLEKVDMPLMKSQYWNDIATDPDRSRRRMAEFLVHDLFPCGLIGSIAVKNEELRKQVELCISGMKDQPTIVVKREWYYG